MEENDKKPSTNKVNQGSSNSGSTYSGKKTDFSKTSQAVADLQKTLDSLKTYNKERSQLKSKENTVQTAQEELGKKTVATEDKALDISKNTVKQDTSPEHKQTSGLENNSTTPEVAKKESVPKKSINLLGKFASFGTAGSKKEESQPKQEEEKPKVEQSNKEQVAKPNILFNKISQKQPAENSNKQDLKPEVVSNKDTVEVKSTTEENKEVVKENLVETKLEDEIEQAVVLKLKDEEDKKQEDNKPSSAVPLANIFDHQKQESENQEDKTALLESAEDEDTITLEVKQKDNLHHDDAFVKEVLSSVKREIEELDLVVDKDGNVLDEETRKRNNSRYLKASFAKIVDMFQISVDQDVLFSNISEAKNGIINTAFLAEAGKRADIRVEINRINLVDIKTNNCILLLKNGKNYVVVDDETLYDPEQDCYVEFNKQEVSRHYIGYTMFFHNQEFSVTEFLKKSTIFSGYIKSNIPMFLEILVLSFLINMFVIVTPFYTINIYDRVIPNNAIETLIVLSTGMALVYIFDFVFKMVRSYITDYVSSDIGNNVDKTLMEKMLGTKSSGITMSNGGKVNLFKELQSIREFYFSRFIPSLIDMPFVVLFLLVLFIISPLMSLVPLIGVIIIFVVNILFQVPLQGSYGNIIRTDQSRVSFLNETVHSVDTIKLFNASGKRLTGWSRSLADYYKSSFKYSFTINTAAHLSLMIMNLLTIAMLIVGVIEIKNLAITVGALIAANTLGTRIVTPMVTFSGLVVRYRSIQQTLLYVQKFMDQPVEDYGLNNASKKGPFNGGIQFDKVSFIYPNNKLPILNKCSFDIKPKEKVGIIGRTGAGKSTITRLLTGLDFPNDGVIKIDGIELDNINIVELRKSIGFLPQKSQFFQATIRDNILLSSKNVTKEQYDRACALSGVDMLKELSGKGDDMIIQEGGTNLSGGQQQIVALARAIINNPPIIIMDEPTNGMDTNLEAKFMENVANYVKDKTFILITHRATQLSLVDRIILFEKGNVVVDDEKSKVLSKLNKGK